MLFRRCPNSVRSICISAILEVGARGLPHPSQTPEALAVWGGERSRLGPPLSLRRVECSTHFCSMGLMRFWQSHRATADKLTPPVFCLVRLRQFLPGDDSGSSDANVGQSGGSYKKPERGDAILGLAQCARRRFTANAEVTAVAFWGSPGRFKVLFTFSNAEHRLPILHSLWQRGGIGSNLAARPNSRH
jgi:hypothetical protein